MGSGSAEEGINALPLASLRETATVTGLTPSMEPLLLETLIVDLATSGNADTGRNEIPAPLALLISNALSGINPR